MPRRSATKPPAAARSMLPVQLASIDSRRAYDSSTFVNAEGAGGDRRRKSKMSKDVSVCAFGRTSVQLLEGLGQRIVVFFERCVEGHAQLRRRDVVGGDAEFLVD